MDDAWIDAYSWIFEDESIEVQEGYWTTREGRKIHISEMETSHLLNTANMLLRRNPGSQWIPRMQRELLNRGAPPYPHPDEA